MKPHPSINRNDWTKNNLITAKDPNEGLPPHVKLSTIKYRYASSDINDVPFNFTYWFNNGVFTLETEFNSNQKRIQHLENLKFLIPIPSDESPQIKNLEAS